MSLLGERVAEIEPTGAWVPGFSNVSWEGRERRKRKKKRSAMDFSSSLLPLRRPDPQVRVSAELIPPKDGMLNVPSCALTYSDVENFLNFDFILVTVYYVNVNPSACVYKPCLA